MKKIYVLAFSLMLLSSISFGDILRVNNQLPTDPSQKLFSSLLEAHNFAKAGDTLMVEGSAVEYTDVTFTKKLIVIGTGYFLSENSGGNAAVVSSVVNEIRLMTGSEGTVLIGLSFGIGLPRYAPNVWVDDIIIMRCFLTGPISIVGNVKNLKILQNYFSSAFTLSMGLPSYSFSNVEFNNNIVRSDLFINLSNLRTFSKVENNIFLSGVNIRAATFRNNIFASTSASLTIDAPIIQNNLVIGTQLTGNGNQTYAATQLFVGPEGNSSDGQYRLKADSPYKAAGFGDTEPGIFGGSLPYVLSGIPPVPSIFEFSADSFGSKEDGLTIQLKAKTNF